MGIRPTGVSAAAAPQAPGLASPQVAVFGDSRCAQNWGTSGDTPAPLARSFLWYLQTLSRGGLRMHHRYNFGVSGDRVSDLRARLETDAANVYGQRPSAGGYGAAVILCGTNSVYAGVPFAQLVADYSACIDLIRRYVPVVVVIAEWPRGTDGTNLLSAANQKLMFRFAEWLRRLRSDSRVFGVVDVWPESADPAAADCRPLPGMLASTDWVHNSPGIALATAEKLAALLRPMAPDGNYAPASNGDLYDAANNPLGCLNTNPLLRGTAGTFSGGATGAAPDGASLQQANSLVAVGEQTTVDGRPAYRITVSGTPSADNSTVNLRLPNVRASVVAGDRLEMGMDFIVAGAHQNFAAPGLMIDTGVTASRVYGGLGLSGDSPMPAARAKTYRGVSLSAEYLVPAEIPASLTPNVRLFFSKSGVPASAVIDIFSAWVRKV